MKKSINVVGAAIIKQLAINLDYPHDDLLEGGQWALKELSYEINNNDLSHEIQLWDGSGVSRENFVSPFAVNELLPGVVDRDRKKIWPKEQVKKMSELGFMGMMVDEQHNGGGMDTISYTIVMEEIARVDASASVIMSVNNSLVCSILNKYGSDFQKNKYLKKLSTGDNLGAFSLSEPQSGSDASNMLTYAEKKQDVYNLSGTKNWVTNGINSDITIVFAVTEKNIGHKGISCFIVEKDYDGFDIGNSESPEIKPIN